MKRLLCYLTTVVVLSAMTPLSSAPFPQPDAWKEVDQAIEQGLPQTALEKLAPLRESLQRGRDWGQLAKAIAYQLELEGRIQGNKPEEKILRMAAEIERSPRELLPLLETVQANWFWTYFQQNRWRFLQRTATAEEPGEDFTTWDLRRLFAEIDRHYQAALSNPRTLQQTPVNTFDGVLEPGTMPDAYRPTLFDFIAHQALEFYTSGEQAGARPEDDFVLQPDSPIFADTVDFLAWQPLPDAAPGAPVSPLVRAVSLHQELVRFHQWDAGLTARAHAELNRIQFGWEHAAEGEAKAKGYEAALERFVKAWGDIDVGAEALCKWAELKRTQENLVEAHRLATRGATLHPDSPGGKLCRNLILQIETPEVTVSTEEVWNQPWPTIDVGYRNVNRVYFRAVPWPWEEFLQREHSRPEQLGKQEERQELLRRQPALTWDHALPPTTDFLTHVENVPAPTTLKPGYYFLVASFDPEFSDQNNQVLFTPFWVSDLALVTRSDSRGNALEGFVIHAVTGEPIAGAEVVGWYLDKAGNRVPHGPLTRTDADGLFRIQTAQDRRSTVLRARHRMDGTLHEIASSEFLDSNRYGAPNQRTIPTTIFFTDRAIYRPDQTIFFKGLCILNDQQNNSYKVVPNQKLTVVFKDPNGRELGRQQLTSSANGSFFGQFTSPTGAGTGRCIIQVEDGPRGIGLVSVEEYKRPKFKVELAKPTIQGKLGETIEVTGEAASYTGAAVDYAKVTYRVVREVRWPIWWGWARSSYFPMGNSQEIAHGETTTDVQGRFTIAFEATPDPALDPAGEPVFQFTVYADITDSAGETRSSSQQVRVGYTALQAVIESKAWVRTDEPTILKIRTTTLDDTPQAAEGTLRIYRLKAPSQVERASLQSPPSLYGRPFRGGTPDPSSDASATSKWELGDLLTEMPFKTSTNGIVEIRTALSTGAYRVLLETRDRFGEKVTAILPLGAVDPQASRFEIPLPQFVLTPETSVEPGGRFSLLWGTGYGSGRACIEIEHQGRILQRTWTSPNRTQQQTTYPVTEELRGGFYVHITQVRENRSYLQTFKVNVPWSNKDLDISWEHLTSKLEPGQKETWTAVVRKHAGTTGEPDWEPALAELVATLYDASLDAYLPHRWQQSLGAFRQDHTSRFATFENSLRNLQQLHGAWSPQWVDVSIRYRDFIPLLANSSMYPIRTMMTRGMMVDSLAIGESVPMPAAAAPRMFKNAAGLTAEAAGMAEMADGALAGGALAFDATALGVPNPAPDLEQVTVRKNLQETAAFFPQLVSNSNGVIRITFTMPEALTTWRFMGLAHDRELRTGYIEASAITSKDLMVQPNPPRFLREGDVLEFTVKVTNQSAERKQGRVRLNLTDTLTGNSVDRLLDNRQPEQDFDLPAHESRSFSWRLSVPDNTGFLTYKAVAASGSLADGEEGYLPVLSRRIFVTESMPLPINGPGSREFEFDKLLQSDRSRTLQHQGLTVQMVSNPSWYAVMALPYLMEFPHECSEQTFNRYYANALASHIANSNPQIRRTFDQWRDTPTLDSPLQKNQDLKSLLIEETPWLRNAQKESEARRNVGVLFDAARLKQEQSDTLAKLFNLQLPDGTWPWFPGGQRSDYITLYIATGFGRLEHLGVRNDPSTLDRAWTRLDAWLNERFTQIQKRDHPEDYVPSSIDALHLYGRSFFLKDRPIAHGLAYDFFLQQARKFWVKTGDRQTQGHIALALHRWGGQENLDLAKAILRSLKEYSVTDDEMGRFWRDTELSWWWYRAPIETQALMIEAFDEIAQDTTAVEQLKVWLLKQKQTQDWKTTKATADAVYALLLRGSDLLASTNLVEVQVGNLNLTPGRQTTRPQGTPAARPEPGTGFYEHRFSPTEITADLGKITVRKTDPGIAWGGIHWQYLEDMSRVTPHTNNPLTLRKTVSIRRNSPQGPVLTPVKGAIEVGDELLTRIELRVDRDMEFVHLKDQRGSGTEPVNVLSSYKYQDGLAYYESTRDTASHFFIDYLPKGTYVFEYASRIQHRGQYQTGIAEIQCMYAPEFNSHSESTRLVVK